MWGSVPRARLLSIGTRRAPVVSHTRQELIAEWRTTGLGSSETRACCAVRLARFGPRGAPNHRVSITQPQKEKPPTGRLYPEM